MFEDATMPEGVTRQEMVRGFYMLAAQFGTGSTLLACALVYFTEPGLHGFMYATACMTLIGAAIAALMWLARWWLVKEQPNDLAAFMPDGYRQPMGFIVVARYGLGGAIAVLGVVSLVAYLGGFEYKLAFWAMIWLFMILAITSFVLSVTTSFLFLRSSLPRR